MSSAAPKSPPEEAVIADLLPACRDAVEAADRLTDAALRSVGLMRCSTGNSWRCTEFPGWRPIRNRCGS